MKPFSIRAYTKKELALCYLPHATNAHSAVNTLMNWINRCHPLRKALEAQGYRKSTKWFSPKQVALIAEYLGTP